MSIHANEIDDIYRNVFIRSDEFSMRVISSILVSLAKLEVDIPKLYDRLSGAITLTLPSLLW